MNSNRSARTADIPFERPEGIVEARRCPQRSAAISGDDYFAYQRCARTRRWSLLRGAVTNGLALLTCHQHLLAGGQSPTGAPDRHGGSPA